MSFFPEKNRIFGRNAEKSEKRIRNIEKISEAWEKTPTSFQTKDE